MTPDQKARSAWALRVEAQRTNQARGLHNDRLYITALVVIWFAGELLFAYKTLPGGVGMVPMFLFLTLFNLSLCLWAWRHRDAF